jgi:glycosyltransferase involved in cell wall biosynthesis
MIPCYAPTSDYLAKTLRSVLGQDPGLEKMEIEVVDDCSPGGSLDEVVRRIGGDRIAFHREAKTNGLPGIWNRCLELSHGDWVHILHQDDYVLPGFYAKVADVIARHPDIYLVASRSFLIDEQGVIIGVTDRVKNLEQSGSSIEDFFYGTPIQCPGVVVRRSAYEKWGGFRPDLQYVVDCEMWARVISSGRGIVLPDVLACYRTFDSSASGRMARTAENVRDLDHLHSIFSENYSTFNLDRARRRSAQVAFAQAEKFRKSGDQEAAAANRKYWRDHAPLELRLQDLAYRIGHALFG